MKFRPAKFMVASLIVLSSLALASNVFSQRKPLSAPRAKADSSAVSPSQKNAQQKSKSNGVTTLCLTDTLDVAKVYGKESRIEEFSKANVKVKRGRIYSNGKPGSFSGRLYNGGKYVPLTVRFSDCAAKQRAKPAEKDAFASVSKDDGQSASRDRFFHGKKSLQAQKQRAWSNGWLPITPVAKSAGALAYTNEYGKPGAGLQGAVGFPAGEHVSGQVVLSLGSSFFSATRSGVTNFSVNSVPRGSYTVTTINCNTVDLFFSNQYDIGQFVYSLGRKSSIALSFVGGPLLNVSVQYGNERLQEIEVDKDIVKNGELFEGRYDCFVLSAGAVLGARLVFADKWELSVLDYVRATRWRDYHPVGDAEKNGYVGGKGDTFYLMSAVVSVSYILK